MDNSKFKYTQLKGPFESGRELINDIYGGVAPSSLFIEHIGIQSVPGHFCKINGINFKIGQTGILEIRDASITSLSFSQKENEETIVDCFLIW